jgi:hypothetical protein
MAYDLISPNGPKALGVVTDAERFAHQKLMDAQQMALRDAAAKAGGGASGATEGNDPFFSESGPFGIAPKQTGAVDLASRNAMVDMRQQATRQVEDAANIAKGYTPGYERKLNQMKGEDAIKRESQQEALRDLLNQRVQGAFGGAAGGGAPGATSVPMPSPGRGGANALVGPDNSGTSGAPAGRGHMSEDDMLELQMLGSLANGGAAPDVTGAMNKRAERDQAAQKFALEMQKAQIEMENAKRTTATGRVADAQAAGDQTLAAKLAAEGKVPLPAAAYAQVSTDPQIAAKLKNLGDIIANNNLYFSDANLDQVGSAFQDLTRLLDTVHASPDAKARILQDARDKMRVARESAQGLWHGQGMGKLDGYINAR